jgi:hypothetical protein
MENKRKLGIGLALVDMWMMHSDHGGGVVDEGLRKRNSELGSSSRFCLHWIWEGTFICPNPRRKYALEVALFGFFGYNKREPAT